MLFSGKFIQRQKEYNTYEHNVAAPYFRKTFSSDSKAKEVRITICGLGFYELYINGENITKGVLAPYVSNPDHILYYDSYDITDKIQNGKNVIGVILGNGLLNNPAGNVWDFDKAEYRDAPKLAFALEVDGVCVFEADESFVTADSPIIFDDYRSGEQYDATKEIEGWNKIDFDDSGWDSAVIASVPKGDKKLAECDPVREIREINPVKIEKQGEGYLYSFAENITGVCRLKVDGKLGQKISLTHGELLIDGIFSIDNICFGNRSNRDYIHKDVYICKGEKGETYQPRFTYHGFQYVFVEGIEEHQATEELLTYVVIHSDLKSAGGFTCSNEMLNRIQENTRRSTLSNFHYFLTDCPHREKNGWTGDAALSALQVMYNFHPEKSLREWMNSLRKTQKPNGQLPGIAPSSGWGYHWGNGPAWDAALTEIPYCVYRFKGDKTILEENYEAIEKYISYLETKLNEDGLVAFGLGDWCQSGIDGAGDYVTPLEITDSIVCMDILFKAARIFDVLGVSSEKAVSLREKLRSNFRKKYIHDGEIKAEFVTQSSLSMSVFYNVLEDSEKFTAVLRLVDEIEKDGRFNVGILGGRVIFRVLSEYGYGDLAYKIITQKDNLSYGQHVSRGATTLMEDFRYLYKDSLASKDPHTTHSLNHHFWGDISAWMSECVAGLSVNPNFKNPYEIRVKPDFISVLDYAKAEHEVMGEKITVEWKRENGKTDVKVSASDKFVILK